MPRKSILSGLVIRTAQVFGTGYGLIYACDPAREKIGQPHVYVIGFDGGTLTRDEGNYDVHSVCPIELPGEGLVAISEAGYYTVEAGEDFVSQDLFQNSAPLTASRRARGLRSVSEIAGYAHAVGYQGMVYRLDHVNRWTRIDEGLPESFDIEAAHGLGVDDLYVAGGNGEAWHLQGGHWSAIELPTNQTLTSVRCLPDGTVYMAGHRGTLVRGRKGQWSVLPQADMDEAIWDLEWFNGQLFASTLDGLYLLTADQLVPVNFGKHTPGSTYQLSAVGSVMWSSGEFDIVEFNGSSWSRIV